MGRESKTFGVTEKSGNVFVDLRPFGGKRISTGMAWNPDNRNAAIATRKLVERDFKAGNKTAYSLHFPDSRPAGELRLNIPTLDEMVEVLLGTLEASKMSYSEQNGLTRNLRNVWCKMLAEGKRLGSMRVNAIDAVQIQQAMGWYIKEQKSEKKPEGLEAKSICNYYSRLKKVFHVAMQKGYISVNPVELLDYPDLNKEMKNNAYTVDEAEAIIGGFLHLYGPVWMHMVTLAFFTGMRIEEWIALLWKHVDLAKGIVYVKRARVGGVDDVTKTRYDRSFKLCPRAKAALISLRQITGNAKHGHVCEIDGKTIFGSEALLEQWKEVCAHVGVERELTTRHTRNSFETWMMSIIKPGEIKSLAKGTGHSPATMMESYVGVQEEMTEDEQRELQHKVRDAIGRDGPKVALAA